MERRGPEENPCCREVELRKQLLLLATPVVGVTYMVSGKNVPGRVSQENISDINRRIYFVFHYSNPTVLAAAVVVIFLLLLRKPRPGLHLVLLRLVTWLVLVGLMANQIAATPDLGFGLYTITLFSINLGYIFLQVLPSIYPSPEEEPRQGIEELDSWAPLKPKEQRKVSMLFASFMMVITYVAGLNSSSGYWGRFESNNQGDKDILMGLNQEAKVRFIVFFYFNITTFMASQSAIVLLLSKNTAVLRCLCPSSYRNLESGIRSAALYGSILTGLVCLLGAYAAGTYQNTDTNVYVLCLMAAFLAYISLVIVMISKSWWCGQTSLEHGAATTNGDDDQEEPVGNTIRRNEAWRKVKSLIVMLAILVAAITYQVGLHPPGGVWPDGHDAGDPIILSTHPLLYKVFLYCNSGAFVSSLATILTLMAHMEKTHATLLVSVILEIVALMGAYAAGGSMDGMISMVVFLIVSIVAAQKLLCVTLCSTDMDYARLVKKRHTRLLVVTNLVAAITYQGGLNPPGSFQHQEDTSPSGGAALLNMVSFMATMGLILFFLVSPNQYRLGTTWYALYMCIVLALIGLMAAYALETVTIVQRYVFALLAIVVSVIAVHTIKSRSFMLKKEEEEEQEEEDGTSAVAGPATIPRPRPRPTHIPRTRHKLRSAQETKYRQVYTSHKHLMLLGILAAGATYQNGLNPPGGLWQDNGNHGSAGSPVLYDKYRQRYLVFFYSNSTSFVASVFIVTLQLHQIMQKHQLKHKKLLALATNTALVLDLLCILAAYAAGTIRGLGDTIMMVVLVLFCVGIHAAPWIPTLYS